MKLNQRKMITGLFVAQLTVLACERDCLELVNSDESSKTFKQAVNRQKSRRVYSRNAIMNSSSSYFDVVEQLPLVLSFVLWSACFLESLC